MVTHFIVILACLVTFASSLYVFANELKRYRWFFALYGLDVGVFGVGYVMNNFWGYKGDVLMFSIIAQVALLFLFVNLFTVSEWLKRKDVCIDSPEQEKGRATCNKKSMQSQDLPHPLLN